MQAWQAIHTADGVKYRIDVTHPAIKGVIEDSGSLAQEIKAMLRVIEETVPIQKIWLDTTEGKETSRCGFSSSTSHEVKSILEIMYKNMVLKKGLSPTNAKELLIHTEPFQNYPELVSLLSESPRENEEVNNG
jgi:hypothetical protein